MSSDAGNFPTWRGRWTFILAATGSAVGLGNIWKFPYIAGENGGGTFVLVYLACILLVGIPVMVAEVMLGRRGRHSPVNTMRAITAEVGARGYWRGLGWLGWMIAMLVLSFYSVIAGWALAYIPEMAIGAFQGVNAQSTKDIFDTMLQDRDRLILWHTVFMLMTAAVVTAGVTRGLGAAARVLMPILFILLVILLVFSYWHGDFARGFSFLFSFDFSKLTLRGVLEALGHAFFTLSLGVGAIMAYGAYMPADASIGKTVLTVALLDTVVALMAGMAIFPIVFAHGGIDPGAGPALLFVTLPVAFGAMEAGILIGGLFFILVVVAAWSSAISLLEPGVAWLAENRGFNRFTATLLLATVIWLLGLGTVLSFNDWAEYKFAGLTFFDGIDFLTSRILLPLSGLLIAIFVGWVLAPDVSKDELNGENSVAWPLWYWVLRYVCPPAIGIVLVVGLYDSFS